MNILSINKSLQYRINQKLQKLLYKHLDLRWKLRSGLTVQVKNQAEWVIFNDIFVDGEYDIPVKQVLASGLDKGCLNVLDLGANVGFFTLRLADLILQVKEPQPDFRLLLVEGSPTIYEELKSRLENQANLAEKITIVHGLVGEREGSATILESDFHVMNSITFGSSDRGKIVPYVDLESLYPESFDIHLLKCDIEGSELVFLENYKDFLSRVKSAVFELHHDKCDTSKCFEIMKNAGFFNHQQLRKEPTFSLDFFWR